MDLSPSIGRMFLLSLEQHCFFPRAVECRCRKNRSVIAAAKHHDCDRDLEQADEFEIAPNGCTLKSNGQGTYFSRVPVRQGTYQTKNFSRTEPIT